MRDSIGNKFHNLEIVPIGWDIFKQVDSIQDNKYKIIHVCWFEYIVLMQGFFVGTEHDELDHGGSKEKVKQQPCFGNSFFQLESRKKRAGSS